MQNTLTKDLVLKFLKTGNLMAVATVGEFPWIANVYYTFDNDLNLYFLSDPSTLHCQHILTNPRVAVSIFDSHQEISKPKKGLQLYGEAFEIKGVEKIRFAFKLWKNALNFNHPDLTEEKMVKKICDSRMYRIIPKRIKHYNDELFDVKDGQEPVLEL